MKKKVLVVSLVLAVGLSLAGCKSTDYKEAVELEKTGDYAAALELFNTVSDYKDAQNHIENCQSMVDAIAAFDAAAESVSTQNTQLDSAVADAEKLISEGKPALDETLIPTLETAISETKAAKVEAPEMPSVAEEILAKTEELKAVDYSSVLATLSESRSVLEASIAQYALVDNPTESYIIECLGEVEHVIDISAVTEDNDPNGKLNKAGGYTAQVYFTSDLVDQNSVYGTTVIDKGTSGGGSIEVYSTAEDATKREEYLAAFDGGIFASGSHKVVGTCLVRTSDELTASEQQELEDSVIAALISLD